MKQFSPEKELQPDLNDAKSFLEILDPNQDRHLFRTIDDNKVRKDKSLITNNYKNIEKAAPYLIAKQKHGAGVFVRIHDAEGPGGKKENIKTTRAIWVDDDHKRQSHRTDWPIKPTVIVESSPGKFHYYWMISNPRKMSFDKFNGIMASLVQDWGHDKNASKLTQIMRLPGFYHQKHNPFLTKIVNRSGQLYSVSEITKAFPPSVKTTPRETNDFKKPCASMPDPNWTQERVRKVIDCIPQQYIDERDSWIQCGAALNHQFGDEGLELFDYLSQKSVHYDQNELQKDFKSFKGKGIGRCTIGTLLYYASQNPEYNTNKHQFFSSDEESITTDDFVSQIIHFKDLRFSPCDEWLIKGLLGRGDNSCIAGGTGIGKSFFMLDASLSIARGVSFRGLKTLKTGVLYISLEGNRNIINRLLAYKDAHNILDDIPFLLLPVTIDLHGSKIDAEKIINTHQILKSNEGEVGLIVIDTLAQALAGGDENNSSDMGKLIKLVNEINYKTGAHICLVHHHGKETSKGLRGHSSLKAALDTVIEIKDFKGTKVAEITKQKDGESGVNLPFQLQQITLGYDVDGDEVTSCIVKHLNGHNHTHEVELTGQTKKTFNLIKRTISSLEGFNENADQIKISKDKIGERFIEDNVSSAISQSSKRKAMDRALQKLQQEKLIGFDKESIWLINADKPQDLKNAA